MKNELVIQETFGNVPSKLEFKSNFNWSILNGLRANKDSINKSYPDELEIIKDDKYEILEKKDFLKIPDHCKFEKYLQFTKKENSNFEIVNDKYINYLSEFLVGGGGGNSESTSFNIGSLQKTKGNSSKLDYSKRSIRKYLKDSFDLKGTELNSKVNDLYIRLSTINREVLNREVTLKEFESQLNEIAIVDNKLTNKGYSNDFKLTRSGKVTKQINFIIWLHNGYKLSNVNLDDLKQDLILYYLQRQTLLLKHYRQAVKRFKAKYEVNYRFSYSTFIFKVLKKEFRKKVNSYLYTVNIPFEVEKNFVKKTKSVQKKSKAYKDLIVISEFVKVTSQSEIQKVNSYKDKTKSKCKFYQKRSYKKSIDQKVEVKKLVQEKISTLRNAPSIPRIKYTKKDDHDFEANSCFKIKRSTASVVGGQLYFDLSNKYNDNQKSNLSIDQLLNKNKLSFAGIENEVFSLRVDGFSNNQIINLLEIKKDKLRNAIRSINCQLASEQLPTLTRIRK